ncbi:MAG: prolyl oligopeptidase family serine peptidase, partial [Chitinivibrionales bacterium]|nr:prolyl oligopeptidase family serine peptidase [Chitinivibrionales bacterium]
IWTNACYPNVYGADGRWLFPTKWAVAHFAADIWDIEANGPFDKNSPLRDEGSYFALFPEYPFAGAYYPSPNANHIRVTDPAKYPGAKIYNHDNDGPPYELWGSTNNVFEVPEDFVGAFETNDLIHRYYMARGIGVAEYASEHIAIGIDGGTFSLTAPYDNVVTVYEYDQSSNPVLEDQLIGPGIVLTGPFSQGLRVVTDDSVELCNVRLPLVFQDNYSEYADILASAQRSDLQYHPELDAWHGHNYELEDIPGKTRVLSSLASLLAVDNISASDDPDILVSMANTAYRHGGFGAVSRYIDSLGGQRPQSTNYLQALMDLETTGSGDFSNTPIAGNYFLALQHVKDGTPGPALPLLDDLLAQKPGAIRPRLLRAYLNADINEALAVVTINPGSIEAWTVLNEPDYPGASDKLSGLLDQNMHATYRMNDFIDEIQNGNWRHERRFEYANTWWEQVATSMPEFPSALEYIPGGVNQPPTVALTSPSNYDHFSEFSDINISATADDIDGSVTVVEFYEGATLLGTDNTAPYSFTWSSVAAGSYTLTAIARDNQSEPTTSDPVYITVGDVQAGLFQEQFGVCVMEAENAHRVDQRSDVTNWTNSTSVAGFVGNGYMIVPEGTGGGDNTWETNCELAFDVYISTPGTYRIAVRYRATGGTSNSAKYGVDGVVAHESDFWEIVTSWSWFHGANPLGYLDAGPHTVQIRRREDGWQVDRVMIAINSTDFPAHLSNVDGPAESPLTGGGNELPTVSITAPAEGSTFDEPADITVAVNATDTDGSISLVEFYEGVTKLGEDSSAPYEYLWTAVPEGNYSLTAKATDNDGGETVSDAINISVVTNQPPTVVLTAPVDGAGFAEGADISLAADAADIDGSVALVEFFEGAAKLGEDTSAPFQYTWTTAPSGIYDLTARASDNDGAVSGSPVVQITVGNVPPVADAGDDLVDIAERTGVTLDGSGSGDLYGDPLVFQWTQAAGKPVILDDPGAMSPSFTSPSLVNPDTLEFQLIVDDGMYSDTDTVAVSVHGAYENLDFDYRTLSGTGTIPYRLFIPPEVAGPAPIPLVVFLHGAGGRGTDNNQQIDEYRAVREWAQPAAQAAHPCLVAAPQCPGSARWSNLCNPWPDPLADPPLSWGDCWSVGSHWQVEEVEPMTLALEMIDSLKMEFNVDPDRVYIVGRSMGGYGTWDAIARRPDLFAAAIPICGAGALAKADVLTGMGIWAFHGDADGTVPVSGSRDMVDAIGAAGGTPRYTEFPGAGHSITSLVWDTPGIIEWTHAHVKGDLTPPSIPTAFDASPAGPRALALSWEASQDLESGVPQYAVFRDGQFLGALFGLSYADNNLNVNTTYTYEIFAVNGSALKSDPCGPYSVTTTDASETGAFIQDAGSDGIVCFEIENFHTYVQQGNHDWTLTTGQSGYSGSGALEATPNSGTNNNTGYLTGSPRCDFVVDFAHTGAHYVWARGIGASGSDDSYHAGLDNTELSTCDRISSFGTSWTWSKATMDGSDATFDVPSTGEHTFNVWMREDGARIDKIVIT